MAGTVTEAVAGRTAPPDGRIGRLRASGARTSLVRYGNSGTFDREWRADAEIATARCWLLSALTLPWGTVPQSTPPTRHPSGLSRYGPSVRARRCVRYGPSVRATCSMKWP